MKRGARRVMVAAVLAVVVVMASGCETPDWMGNPLSWDSLEYGWRVWYGAHAAVLVVFLALLAVLAGVPVG